MNLNPIASLLILALPVACISWTVTHEEIFREFHEYCEKRHREAESLLGQKFVYMFTFEYCFRHYVAIAALLATRFALLSGGWVGYLISFFAVAYVANFYMSIYALIRAALKNQDRKAGKAGK